MPRKPVFLLLLASALLAGVPGALGARPTPGALLGQGLRGVGGKQSVHYALKLTVAVKAAPGSQLGLIAGRPLTFNVVGGIGPNAITATLSTGILAQGAPVKAVLTQKAGYVSIAGRWYGSKQLGLQSLAKSGSSGSGASGSLASLRQSLGKVVKGSVTEGPTLAGGVQTWKFTGTLDPVALAATARAGGTTVKPKDLAALQGLAKSTSVTALVARGSGLLVELHVVLALTQDTLKALQESSIAATAGTAGAALKGVESLNVDLDAAFTDWGKPVRAQAPATFAPLEQLLGPLLGGLGGA